MDKKIKVESPPQNYGNNGTWDFKKALQEKTVCGNCKSAEGPFGLLVNAKSNQPGIPMVRVVVCGCFESLRFGSVQGMGGSCEEFLVRPVNRIAIARTLGVGSPQPLPQPSA